MKKLWLLVALLSAATPVTACLQDRDTLAEEAAANKTNATGLPHVVRVITGRFERNPPLYYEVRLKRVSQELKTRPNQLELYDDAAVACDRLHRSKEALVWIKKKRDHLAVANLAPTTKREQWYRYYANAGTFHAHHWLRSGANRKEMRELRQGRDLIRQAIAIKPSAHFGREKYQLRLMEWILCGFKSNGQNKNLRLSEDFLGLADLNEEMDYNSLENSPHADAVTGLSGLIVLGDAWMSFDVYYALVQALGAQGDNRLSALASQRCKEILKDGGKSLNPKFNDGEPLSHLTSWPREDGDNKDIHSTYVALRAEAQEYQKARWDYMNRKLSIGKHPDTDSTFWNEWQEPPLPSLEGSPSPPWKPLACVVFLILPVLYMSVLYRRRITKDTIARLGY